MSKILPGTVLGSYEHNGYHDSYFFAIYWSEEEGKVKIEETGATAYGGGGYYDPDATAEVLAKAAAYAKPILKEWAARDAAREALIAAKGDSVEVFKGRKFPKGKKGKVLGDPKVTYRKPYSELVVKKALVAWDGENAADLVDIENLKVLNAAEKEAALLAEKLAKIDSFSESRAVSLISGGHCIPTPKH